MLTTDLERPLASSAPQHDLASLARLDTEALAALYAAAAIPTTVTPLAGQPRGRMLAVRGLERGPLHGWIARLAAATFFPWGGKSFAGAGKTGTGINRVQLGGAGRHNLFPFATNIGPSALDGRDAVILDYDLPENPGVIRAIHDEVRAIEPGLYLGPAMWKGERGKTLVLWFALDCRGGEGIARS